MQWLTIYFKKVLTLITFFFLIKTFFKWIIIHCPKDIHYHFFLFIIIIIFGGGLCEGAILNIKLNKKRNSSNNSHHDQFIWVLPWQCHSVFSFIYYYPEHNHSPSNITHMWKINTRCACFKSFDKSMLQFVNHLI